MLTEDGAPPVDHAPVPGPRAVIKAALLPMFPAPILRGGLELQCLKTAAALRRIGVDAEMLDYYNPESRFDILHLFPGSQTYHEICEYAAGRWPIVVSAVCGGRAASRMRPLIWGAVSRLAAAAKAPTIYDQKRVVYRSASVVLCNTPSEVEFVRVTFGVERNRIRIITNGVEDEVFQASPRLFHDRYGLKDFVLFTGNIVRRKNPLLLAQVLADMGHPGVFLGGRVAAEADYADEFERVVARSPHLLWVPGIPHDDPLLASAYAGASVFCLPSAAETQSHSALEAMAAGSPLILADLLYAHQPPLEHSVKVPLGDGGALKKALEKVLCDPAAYRRQLPDSYRWTAVAARIADIYAELLPQRRDW